MYRLQVLIITVLVCLFSMYAVQGYSQNNVDNYVRYDGHKMVRVQITSDADLATMRKLSPDIWSDAVGIGPVDYRIPPEAMDELAATGLNYEVMIDDLQVLIDKERAHLIESNKGGAIAGDDWFLDYKTYDQVNARIDELVAQYPTLASRINVGTSLQGRSIFGIKVTSPNGSNKSAALFNGAQHAREWVAVMVPMYLADRLLREYDIDPYVQDLMKRIEFYIVPISNPDGYVYSWTNDRYWRKNRRSSYGVDLNRNWGYNWGGEGSSGQTWDETYRGTAAFSEPETAAFRDFILGHPKITTHIDIHSYSQLVLQPWNCCSQRPPDHSEFEQLGSEMVTLIKQVHNKTYYHGQGYFTIYPASGVAHDWTYAETGATAFGIELRDTGSYGFVLPANQILPNAEEVYPAFLHFAEHGAPPISGMQLDVDPLYSGHQSELRVTGGTPNKNVYYVYSLKGNGSTYVPALDVTLDLSQPKLGGQSMADGSGNASYMAKVPGGLPVVLIWIQAAQYQNTSNVVATQIN